MARSCSDVCTLSNGHTGACRPRVTAGGWTCPLGRSHERGEVCRHQSPTGNVHALVVGRRGLGKSADIVARAHAAGLDVDGLVYDVVDFLQRGVP